MIRNRTFLKKDYDPCFLLGQNSHCGLKLPLSKAYEADLADVSFLGNGQDPRGTWMPGIPLRGGIWGPPVIHLVSPTYNRASWKVIQNFQTPNIWGVSFPEGIQIHTPISLELPGARRRWCLGREGNAGCTSCRARAWACRRPQAGGQWEMLKATLGIRGDLDSSLCFLYCFSFNTYVM